MYVRVCVLTYLCSCQVKAQHLRIQLVERVLQLATVAAQRQPWPLHCGCGAVLILPHQAFQQVALEVLHPGTSTLKNNEIQCGMTMIYRHLQILITACIGFTSELIIYSISNFNLPMSTFPSILTFDHFPLQYIPQEQAILNVSFKQGYSNQQL